MDETSTMDNYPVPPVERLIEEYCNSQLGSKHKATIEAYSRVLKQFATWLVGQPGSQEQFHPRTITRTVIEIFLGTLNSSSHKNLSRSVISSFCQWLIDEKQILERNPALGINVPPQAFLAPRILNEKQRFAMHQIVERANDIRGEAIFALGYWAGCRVSDVSYLLMEHTHITSKAGWIHVGHKGDKWRDIDLVHEVRRPLYDYLITVAHEKDGHKKKQKLHEQSSTYVFTSQREKLPLPQGERDGWRLTEDGIHLWFQRLKKNATKEEWDLVHNIAFHDLRHDFAHRAREAEWSPEEVLYYLGLITENGTSAIPRTARYTQVIREQVKEKLKHIKG